MKGIYLAGNFLSKSTGITSVCEELAEQFSNRGWYVITASHYRNRLLRMADLLWTAFRYRNHYHLAAVEVYSYLAFRWAELLCQVLKILNRPFILTLHGGMLPEFSRKTPKRVMKLLKSALLVTTPSKYLQAEFVQFDNDIKYMPNGINLVNYPYSLRKKPEPRLVWQHAFHNIYNPRLAVEVLKIIIADYPDAKLTMIGPDKLDGTLKEIMNYISINDLTDKVNIIGSVPKEEVGKYLAEGDIFLNTTNYESFGVSVMEAAACGLCIVTTNVGEMSRLWVNGENAIIVPSNDSQAMALAIKEILSRPDLAARLSINAHRKAERFDWSNVIPMWEELFSTLL